MAFVPRSRRAALSPFLALGMTAVASAQEPPGGYREEARVERVVVDAYVTDRSSQPITDLDVSDFRVFVDGEVVPLESAEWISAEAAEVPSTALEPLPVEGAEAAQAPHPAAPPGRLLIMFFQTSFEPTRLVGFLRMALQAHRFVSELLPTDRVAVVSLDSHLKLRCDFTADHAKIDSAIDQAIRTGPPPPPGDPDEPALASHFDFYGAQARHAITPERAMLLIARAAQPIPGAKSMLFFGWGFGTIGGLGGQIAEEQHDWFAALRRLAAARISIFSLDVTDADYHSMETSLRVVSDLTGGLYEKTHIFPRLALERVRRAISGRYQLVFKRPPGAAGFHEVKVELTKRKGDVFARTYYED